MSCKLCTPTSSCSGAKKSMACPYNAVLLNLDLSVALISPAMSSFQFSASFTAPFSSQSKPEGLWLIDSSPNSRWSSWEDKTFVTCTSYTSSTTMRTILLGVVWLCLGLSLDALSLNGRRIETVDGEGTEAAIRGEKLLKRVRRGWMWNQFFLQEEYTGSDYQYIGKVRALPLLPDFWL